MGFLIRCFCCDFEDEDQPSEQEPILFPASHDAPENGGPLSQRLLSPSPSSDSCSYRSLDDELIPHSCLNLSTDTLHNLNSLEIQECQDYLSNSSTISTDRLQDQNNLEFEECHDYISNSSTTGSLLPDVLISSTSSISCEDSNLHGTFLEDLEVSGLQCSLDSYTPVNHCGLVQIKKKDACLLEELHSQVSVEEDQAAYLPEDLHSPEPKEKNQGGCLMEELLSEGPIEKKQDSCLVEELHFQEPIAKKHDVCLLVKLHFEKPIEKKQDVFSQEELHSEEPIEKNQDVSLLEDLHFEEQTEDLIKGVVAEERWINDYSSFQKILLVGEGDFSFSACLANAFGSASNMIATSHDSREFLRENYRRAITNIENLTSKGCSVIHGVDTKKMANHPLLKSMTFDRIIFNFPFAGFFKTESRESQLRRHRRFVSRFLKNAKQMINETGEIHITHKTNTFHCEWNIEHLASCHGLRLLEAARFHHRNYPGYMTKCGFGGDNYFNCNPSKTYKFGLRRLHQRKEAKRVLWIARSNLDLQ